MLPKLAIPFDFNHVEYERMDIGNSCITNPPKRTIRKPETSSAVSLGPFMYD